MNNNRIDATPTVITVNQFSVSRLDPERIDGFPPTNTRSLFLGPVVGNVTQNPTIVEYTDSPVITCDVLANISSIDHVNLIYRLDNSTWTPITMTNTTAQKYNATISTQPWPSFVEYYVNATDTSGFYTIQVNGSTYYHFTVVDTTHPEVTITWPEGETYISGTVEIEVSAGDEGSGVQSVEIYIGESFPGGMVPVANYTNPPYTYTWITRFHSNGLYILQATAYDGAGNYHDDIQGNVVDNVENRPFDPWPLITLFVVGSNILIIVAVFTVYWIHRKRKAPASY